MQLRANTMSRAFIHNVNQADRKHMHMQRIPLAPLKPRDAQYPRVTVHVWPTKTD